MKKYFLKAVLVLFISIGFCFNADAKIAFTSNRDGNNEIYIMEDCVGCIEQRLTQNPANDYSPAISPDGKTIAFFSNRDGTLRIYKMSVSDPSDVQPLSPPLQTNHVDRIDWHPNGNWLIFMLYESSYWSVWRIDADGSGLARFINGSSQDIQGPHFTKDGNHIVFSKNGHFNAWSGEVYIINADGQTGERQLTNSPDGHDGASLWPEEVLINDVSYVVFSRGVGGVGQHLLIQPTSGTGPATDISAVTNPNVSIWEWGPVSAKAGEIIFDTNRSGSTNIWKMNADGTNAVQLSTGGGWGADWGYVNESGLIAYYPFNGNANDESENGNHGTVSGATLTTDRFGNPDSAYRFDGIDDYISIPNSSTLEIQNALTISAWVKTDDSNFGNYDGQTIISKGATYANLWADYNLVLLTNPTDGLRWESSEVAINRPYYINGSFSLLDSTWHHVTATYSNGNVRLYINGSLIETETVTNTTLRTSMQPLYIGTRYLYVPIYHHMPFYGVIDEVRIYNKALSEAEIQALYTENAVQIDSDGDGTPDNNDGCPNDPNKTEPGICGCGLSDIDSDLDGAADCIDNCPSKFNPDQRNIDSDSKGDVCDICPSVATDICDTNRSTGLSIGPNGGTISTLDGYITIIIPPGALNSDTSISITDTKGTSFELTTNLGQGTALYGVTIGPEGQIFKVPITIIFKWHDSDLNKGNGNGKISEDTLLITKNNIAVTDRCKLDAGCSLSDNTFTFNVSSLSEFALLVLNVPPVIEEIIAPIDPVHIGNSIDAIAHFSDAGFLDTHTAIWNWGDGTISTGTVTESGGAGMVQDNHIYAQAGVYSVTLTVTDKNGDSGTAVFHYVVVYDPDGGFVTGGGWINSPAGAYVPNLSLTGKATFGFVSKYKKGASVPTGNTEFQFKVANLNFRSELYQWLVIAGAKAQYKGTGTINGLGNYGFILTAIDGDLKGTTDKFRIKIWDKNNGDTIVYDNQLAAPDDSDPTTVTGGGSIVIHKQ